MRPVDPAAGACHGAKKTEAAPRARFIVSARDSAMAVAEMSFTATLGTREPQNGRWGLEGVYP